MKRLLTLFILITSIVSLSHSQTATTPEVQSVKPVRNAMTERKVVAIDVDGVTYENVNFSDGLVQVGQGTFIQLLIEKIAKPTAEGEFKATFREKQGIF